MQYHNIIFQTRTSLYTAIKIVDITRRNVQLCLPIELLELLDDTTNPGTRVTG